MSIDEGTGGEVLLEHAERRVGAARQRPEAVDPEPLVLAMYTTLPTPRRQASPVRDTSGVGR